MIRLIARWWVAVVDGEVRYERRGRKEALRAFKRTQTVLLELKAHHKEALEALEVAVADRSKARGQVLELEAENRSLRQQLAAQPVPEQEVTSR